MKRSSLVLIVCLAPMAAAAAMAGAPSEPGSRIDQLYYKGDGLRNTSTRLVNFWPTGFPSDHYLIVAEFDLRSTAE
jgi:hypothetical protein